MNQSAFSITIGLPGFFLKRKYLPIPGLKEFVHSLPSPFNGIRSRGTSSNRGFPFAYHRVDCFSENSSVREIPLSLTRFTRELTW
jgi:hypothetical protein